MAESHKLLDLPLSPHRDPKPESPRRCGMQALNLPRAAERESLQHRDTHKLAREESGNPDQLPNVPPVVSCKAKSRPKQLSPLSCERKSWHVPLPERHTPSGREREMYLNPPPGVVDTETTKEQLALQPPIWMRKSKEWLWSREREVLKPRVNCCHDASPRRKSDKRLPLRETPRRGKSQPEILPNDTGQKQIGPPHPVRPNGPLRNLSVEVSKDEEGKMLAITSP